tara:strand:- start:31 stop:855 length:825 start_codon:yes stop_codon:yes gene_type:complete
MEEERKDIFEGKFGEQQEQQQKKDDLSFSEGAGNLAKGVGHLFSGLRHIFFKSFPLNLLLLLLILGATVAGTLYLKPTVTGAVVYQNVTQECPVCDTCPESTIEEKIITKVQCANGDVVEHEADCPEPKDKVVYMFRCSDGKIVEDESDCKASIPEITSDFNSKANGVTLSIDDVEYDDGVIKKIDYTIINEGLEDIKPLLEIKVYDQWTSEVRNADPAKNIRFTEVIDIDSWVIRSDTLNIDFDEDEDRLRLELKDALISPAEEITAVAMDFR